MVFFWWIFKISTRDHTKFVTSFIIPLFHIIFQGRLISGLSFFYYFKASFVLYKKVQIGYKFKIALNVPLLLMLQVIKGDIQNTSWNSQLYISFFPFENLKFLAYSHYFTFWLRHCQLMGLTWDLYGCWNIQIWHIKKICKTIVIFLLLLTVLIEIVLKIRQSSLRLQ